MTTVIEKSIFISDLLNNTDKITVHPMDHQRTSHDLAFEITEVIETLVWDDIDVMEIDLAMTFPLCVVSIMYVEEDEDIMDIIFEFPYKTMSIYFQNIEVDML